MKRLIAILLCAIMLLGACSAPADTTAQSEIDAPDINITVDEVSDVTESEADNPDSDESSVTEPVVTSPAVTEPPVKVERFDYTINVKEDTHVLNKDGNGDKSDVNYSTETLIDIKSNKGTLTRYGYLKFDISALKGDNDFTAIDLDLFINWKQADPGNPEFAKIEIYGCDLNWSADTLTYNNQPRALDLITSLDDVSGEKITRSFAVTDYVRKALANGQTEIAFYIKEATPGTPLRLKINSSESGENIPKLSVYYGTKVDETTYAGDTILGDPRVFQSGLVIRERCVGVADVYEVNYGLGVVGTVHFEIVVIQAF